jgi:hypothetical protein
LEFNNQRYDLFGVFFSYFWLTPSICFGYTGYTVTYADDVFTSGDIYFMKEEKHLMLMDLKAAYNLYKQNKNNLKVGFGRFCQFRPKNFVFPGAPESHNICVCKIHENFKLWLDAVDIESIVSELQN